MNRLQILQDERQGIARAMRNLRERVGSRAWTAAEQATWDSCQARLDSLDLQIGAQDRAVDAKGLSSLGITIRDSVFDRWMRGGEQALCAEQLSQFRNTMSTTTNTQGGYAVPLSVGPEWVSSLKAAGGVRQVARVIPTAAGTLSWPTSDIGSETGERLDQNAAAASLDPSFGTALLNAAKYSSKLITVPIELLQDSAIDIVGYILERTTARIARAQNPDFTTGAGGGPPYIPQGFVPGSTVGKTGTTGQTLTVVWEDMIDLVGSVNSAYRTTQRQGVAWQMADTSFRIVRKLKDGQGQPIFNPAVADEPEQLLAYPVVINDDMAAMAANAKSIAFGNFTHGYVISDVMEVTLQRFTDSAYIKLGQVGFLAFARSAGAVVDAAAIKLYQNSAS